MMMMKMMKNRIHHFLAWFSGSALHNFTNPAELTRGAIAEGLI